MPDSALCVSTHTYIFMCIHTYKHTFVLHKSPCTNSYIFGNFASNFCMKAVKCLSILFKRMNGINLKSPPPHTYRRTYPYRNMFGAKRG